MFGFGRYHGCPPPPPHRHGGCGCGCGTLLLILFGLVFLAFLEMMQYLFC